MAQLQKGLQKSSGVSNSNKTSDFRQMVSSRTAGGANTDRSLTSKIPKGEKKKNGALKQGRRPAAMTEALNADKVKWSLDSCLTKLGFEVYPLKVGWYNALLPPSLHLDYPDATLAVVVLSTPDMFERAFLPFLENRLFQRLSDPVDQCVKHYITCAISQTFPSQRVDVRYDYELLPSRKPKFLAQTAAHVSGAAFYYQQSDVKDQPWGDKKMFGVCVHPRLGGWFAIRALLVFEDLTIGSEMVQQFPKDCVPSREERIRLLEAFNFCWQDWSYRDIVPPVQTYSQKQKDYFSTKPAERFKLLKTWGFLLTEEDRPDQTLDTQNQTNGHG